MQHLIRASKTSSLLPKTIIAVSSTNTRLEQILPPHRPTSASCRPVRDRSAPSWHASRLVACARPRPRPSQRFKRMWVCLFFFFSQHHHIHLMVVAIVARINHEVNFLVASRAKWLRALRSRSNKELHALACTPGAFSPLLKQTYLLETKVSSHTSS